MPTHPDFPVATKIARSLRTWATPLIGGSHRYRSPHLHTMRARTVLLDDLTAYEADLAWYPSLAVARSCSTTVVHEDERVMNIAELALADAAIRLDIEPPWGPPETWCDLDDLLDLWEEAIQILDERIARRSRRRPARPL
jgi:hypothetical protein